MSFNPKNPRPIIQTSSFRTRFSERKSTGITFPQNSRYTKQSFKDECDINTIMGRYQRTGQLPNLNETAPQYLDVTGYEFQSAMQFVAGAQSMFEELPSAVRMRFKNDPAAFLDFCSNENNRPELAEMGLLRENAPRVIPLDTPAKNNRSESDSASPAS